MKKIVLISGLPSVGKSWLLNTARKKGIFAANMEAPPADEFSLESTGLRSSWNEFCNGNVKPFKATLEGHSEDLILLEWGFPPEYIALIKRMQKIGIKTWWLDADHIAAERSHTAAKKNMERFHEQIAKIDAAKAILDSFYGQNRILRLNDKGEFLKDEDVLRTIFGEA